MELKATLYQATMDELTGINNKSNLMKLLGNHLSMSKLHDIAFIFFDLDHFKHVNDTYGHQAGDSVLAEVGRIIRETVRLYDIAGRYGGEEFLIALPETSVEKAHLVAEKLRNRIKEFALMHENTQIRITASFGISSLLGNRKKICEELDVPDLNLLFAIMPGTIVDWEAIKKKKSQIPNILISFADMALYRSKRTTCSRCFFNSGKADLFIDGKCPECGSSDLVKGRDKSTILFDIFE